MTAEQYNSYLLGRAYSLMVQGLYQDPDMVRVIACFKVFMTTKTPPVQPSYETVDEDSCFPEWKEPTMPTIEDCLELYLCDEDKARLRSAKATFSFSARKPADDGKEEYEPTVSTGEIIAPAVEFVFERTRQAIPKVLKENPDIKVVKVPAGTAPPTGLAPDRKEVRREKYLVWYAKKRAQALQYIEDHVRRDRDKRVDAYLNEQENNPEAEQYDEEEERVAEAQRKIDEQIARDEAEHQRRLEEARAHDEGLWDSDDDEIADYEAYWDEECQKGKFAFGKLVDDFDAAWGEDKGTFYGAGLLGLGRKGGDGADH